MKTGVELIAEERQRQRISEGWTIDHDDQYDQGQLALAAGAYALTIASDIHSINISRNVWPWNWIWWKPTPDNRIKELAKAGALIAAEIDRLQRLAEKQK